jgi:hypothetical protein
MTMTYLYISSSYHPTFSGINGPLDDILVYNLGYSKYFPIYVLDTLHVKNIKLHHNIDKKILIKGVGECEIVLTEFGFCRAVLHADSRTFGKYQKALLNVKLAEENKQLDKHFIHDADAYKLYEVNPNNASNDVNVMTQHFYKPINVHLHKASADIDTYDLAEYSIDNPPEGNMLGIYSIIDKERKVTNSNKLVKKIKIHPDLKVSSLRAKLTDKYGKSGTAKKMALTFQSTLDDLEEFLNEESASEILIPYEERRKKAIPATDKKQNNSTTPEDVDEE